MDHINEVKFAGIATKVKEHKAGANFVIEITRTIKGFLKTQKFSCAYFGKKKIIEGQEISFTGELKTEKYQESFRTQVVLNEFITGWTKEEDDLPF